MTRTAIVIFVLRSIVAGFAQTAGQLIAARAFQGIGVGGLQAPVRVAIAAMIPPRERGRYNGYLGGVIVDTGWLGWGWCFFVGVPVALVALLVLQVTPHLPTVRRQDVESTTWARRSSPPA